MEITKLTEAVRRNKLIIAELKAHRPLSDIVASLESAGIHPPRGGSWSLPQLHHYIARSHLKRSTEQEERDLNTMAQALTS